MLLSRFFCLLLLLSAYDMMPDGGDDYRARKDASISDLTGTSMHELVLVSSIIPMGIWLHAEIKVRDEFV